MCGVRRLCAGNVRERPVCAGGAGIVRCARALCGVRGHCAVCAGGVRALCARADTLRPARVGEDANPGSTGPGPGPLSKLGPSIFLETLKNIIGERN